MSLLIIYWGLTCESVHFCASQPSFVWPGLRYSLMSRWAFLFNINTLNLLLDNCANTKLYLKNIRKAFPLRSETTFGLWAPVPRPCGKPSCPELGHDPMMTILLKQSHDTRLETPRSSAILTKL